MATAETVIFWHQQYRGRDDAIPSALRAKHEQTYPAKYPTPAQSPLLTRHVQLNRSRNYEVDHLGGGVAVRERFADIDLLAAELGTLMSDDLTFDVGIIRDKIAASKKKGLWMGGNVPLGYEPDGRTLKIKEADARIIRTIYDLYRRHGNVRTAKTEVDKLELKTAVRKLSSGQLKGGTDFSFGHIYHILTNPIYAGRIRHHAKVYPGMHPPIIAPEDWDQLQEQLQTGAVMARSGKAQNQGGEKKHVSLLTGKVFDETGDRLTPSHTKTAKGRRLRYYVSHRLIRNSGTKDPGGWRLPGPELESAVARLVAGYLVDPEVAANIVFDVTTEELAVFLEQLSKLDQKMRSPCTETFFLIKRMDITRGRISATLDHEAVAEYLGVGADRINGDLTAVSSEFRHRKRGVETRIILAGAVAPRDETLFRNIARANRYLAMIISGQTFTEIGEIEGVTGRRIQQLVELAFLAPEVIRDVFEGRQPIGLTTEWLLRHAYPASWKDQREIFRSI